MSRNWIIAIVFFGIGWGGIKFARKWMPDFMRIVPQVQLSETKLEQYARLSGDRMSLPKEVVQGLLRLESMSSDKYKYLYSDITILDTSIDYSDNSQFMNTLRNDLWASYQQNSFKKYRDQGVILVWRLTFVDGSKSFQLVARPEGISWF